MRPDLAAMVGMALQNPTQVHLAEDDDVIEAFMPDRSDQAFGKGHSANVPPVRCQ
jgi:hypothetical protein